MTAWTVESSNGVGSLGSHVVTAFIDSYAASGTTVALPWGSKPVLAYGASSSDAGVLTSGAATLTPVSGKDNTYTVVVAGAAAGKPAALVIHCMPVGMYNHTGFGKVTATTAAASESK